jgi:type III secretory pathway component EscR
VEASTPLNPYWLILASFLFSLVPLFIGACTCYLKVSIVFSMLRSGIGTQQLPSAMLVMILSFVITGYVMSPVMEESFAKLQGIRINLNSVSLETLSDTLKPAGVPWMEFMASHAGQREVEVLSGISGKNDKSVFSQSELLTRPKILLPAFVLTELKQAFAMGFVLLLPFLVVDLIVANILAGLGMFMVNPSILSLPVKLLLFIYADGWLLLSKSLISSYGSVNV